MEWLPLEPIRAMVTRDMYEDDDEFEDAIGGSFEVFMAAMPHVELRTSEQGAAEFRVIQPDPLAGAVTMRMRVSEREDLWRVLFKSPGAVLRIPHMEFEIGASAKRQIDSVYNHIAAAAFELASHVRSLGGQLDAGDAEKIGETAADLYELLDVAKTFEVVVDDPMGTSLFKPSDGIIVENADGDVDGGLEDGLDGLEIDEDDDGAVDAD